MSFFSVIIPLYNKECFIENTLKSVLSQTFTAFEVIIINDGSTDKSEEKALQFKDSRIRYYSKENGGVSTARNFGIDKAKSVYITFIDADDYWYPTFLESIPFFLYFFRLLRSYILKEVPLI
uniref:Glycosyltransferase 2-like domain-containing protein n=1 Tax=Hucho hucho TaxID=62062 RepID=A0A4W5LYG6_9TELE